MRFRYDPEHEELRRVVRRFLDDVANEPATREAMETPLGWEPAVVKRLVGELGVFGLAIPEEFGGSGYGTVELGVVFHEAGRALLCAPLLSSSLASAALIAAEGSEAATRFLPAIAAGETLASVALREKGGSWDAAPRTIAVPGPNGWLLSGTKDWVIDGHAADLLIVSATTPDGTALFVTSTDGSEVERELLETVDLTRRFATVTLSEAPAELLTDAAATAGVLRRTSDVARTLLAAEQVGVAQECLEMATEYAKTREQFGQVIGAFQAIKHKLATVALEVEAAISAAMYALWIADEQPESLSAAALIAAYTCSESALLAAAENIQVHGGIGATWEHPAHLYLRRATVDRQLFGDPQWDLEQLAVTITASS